MPTKPHPLVRAPLEVPLAPRSTEPSLPTSNELGADLERLKRQELREIDRRRQEELARLRRVQDLD